MKFKFMIVAAIVAVVSCVLSAGLTPLQGGIALGDIRPGETTLVSLVVSNARTRTVSVSRVKACCGGEATLEPMTVPAGGAASLTLRLKPQIPGEIAKSVVLYCDDPATPIVEIPVTGRVVETAEAGMTSGATLATIVAAGFVDGFNPCSFAIMISLAGILAIGGRRRRARIIGGLSFCVGTFVTYMLMGLGLMQALKALEGLRVVYIVVMLILALALFILSFLSFRDALRFRRIPVFSVVTLRLPEGMKNLIRRIAMAGWRGPSVAFAGLGCGFVITIIDALCTGQVYVPVLALIAREPGAWNAFALLVLYNLAFIAPLVAVFVLASKTTDAFRMARWSSRNVIPAKIALGVVFLILGALILSHLVGRLTGSGLRPSAPPPPVADNAPSAPRVRVSAKSSMPRNRSRERIDATPAVAVICGGERLTADRYEARNDALRSIARRRDLASDDVAALMFYVRSPGGSLRPEREAALRNDILNLLRDQAVVHEGLVGLLLDIVRDRKRDAVLVDYAVQHLGAILHDVPDVETSKRIRESLVRAAAETGRPYAGTALYALADDRRTTPEDARRLKTLTLGLLKPSANSNARLSAMQLAGQRNYGEALPFVRDVLRGPRRDAAADIAAIGALGLMGERSDVDLVRSALDRGGSRLRPAVEAALARIEGRFGGVP